MLHLVFGNRLDTLAEQFIARAVAGRTHALQDVELVVPSLGIGRWLKYRMADCCGVAGGIASAYPAQAVWRLVEQRLPQLQSASPVPGERLRWLIFQWLSEHADGHPALARICAEPLNRWQLAQRLARSFGDYLVFRPQWLKAWLRGQQPAALRDAPHAAWQQQLAQWLAPHIGLSADQHPFEAFFAQDDAATQAPPLHLFALPSLAPLYVEFFARLAAQREVHWYALSPSREYWAQIVDARRAGGDEAAMGHPLLAAWGKAQRDLHFSLSAQVGEAGVNDMQLFTEPACAQALGIIQRDMLNLQPGTPFTAQQGDDSVRMHACHSLLRQVECLHDALLEGFRRHADWRPGDVLVLTPELEAAAPLVEAVFSNAQGAARLPFRITGLAAGESAGLTQALLALLSPPQSPLGRFEVSAVLALLRRPAIAAAFGFGRDELQQVQQWLAELGVHAGNGELAGGEAWPRHTWPWGMARLLLGTVQPDAAAALSTGLLPYAQITAGDTELIGKLVHFVAALEQWRDSLSQPASIDGWAERLEHLLKLFFAGVDDDTQDWLTAVRRALAQWRGAAADLPAAQALPAPLLRSLLADALRDAAPGAVPVGEVCFARLGELRGLPYKAVFLLGVEGESFPRDDAEPEYDLMRHAPQRGDRSRRADDRGAFLDAMLAARDSFQVFYCGRDAVTNDVLAPASPVQELLAQLCLLSGTTAQHWLREHTLQPFSAAAFQGLEPSFSRQYYGVARNLGEANSLYTQESIPASWLKLERAVPLEEGDDTLRLDAWARWWAEPAEAFVRDRLGVRLADDDSLLADQAPARPDALQAWQLKARLLAVGAEGASAQEALRWAMAGPELPSGPAGEAQLTPLLDAARSFREACKRAAVQPLREATIEFEFAQRALHLKGEVSGDCWVQSRFGSLKLRDLAQAALTQAVRALHTGLPNGPLLHVARDKVLQLPAFDAMFAEQLLRDGLLALQQSQAQCRLLPARTAWAYWQARRLAHHKQQDASEAQSRALTEAQLCWRKGEQAEARTALWRCLLSVTGDLPPAGWQQALEQGFDRLLPLAQLTPLEAWLRGEAGQVAA